MLSSMGLTIFCFRFKHDCLQTQHGPQLSLKMTLTFFSLYFHSIIGETQLFYSHFSRCFSNPSFPLLRFPQLNKQTKINILSFLRTSQDLIKFSPSWNLTNKSLQISWGFPCAQLQILGGESAAKANSQPSDLCMVLQHGNVCAENKWCRGIAKKRSRPSQSHDQSASPQRNPGCNTKRCFNVNSIQLNEYILSVFVVTSIHIYTMVFVVFWP